MFCNLHNHTTVGSALDGYSKIDEMVQRAVELNQSALAITDHGTMTGVLDFKQKCEDAGIKPVIGIEFYATPHGKDIHWRRDDGKRRGTSFHLTCWSYNQQGYQNLLKLVELSNKVGFYYNPRVDQYMLEQYNEGLIITSGCMASEVCQLLNPETGVNNRSYIKVREIFTWAMDIFGTSRYYLEIQDHGIPELREINLDISRINQQFGFEYLVTNDAHYSYPYQATGQADLLCVQARCSRNNPNNFVRTFQEHPDYYLTSADDMKAKDYGFDVPDSAFYNTIRISEMAETIHMGYEPEIKKYRFPVMSEYEDYDYSLNYLAEEGFLLRYPAHSSQFDMAKERLIYELNTINGLGFSSYFLCVYDLKQYCDKQGIPVTVRGSAGGSIVLYCLGVTDFCPLKYNLLFERFLNSDRVSAPDVDLDIDPSRRDEVIKYLVDKYGEDHTAQVITLGKIKGRGAIRDATRIMDLPYELGDSIAKMIDNHPKASIKATMDENSEFYNADFVKAFTKDEALYNVALGLEGQVRSIGIHAGAVMLSDRPLVEDYPLVKPGSKSSAVTRLLVGFDYETAEAIGGIKLDILGVEALGITYLAIDMINQRHNTNYTFETIPTDDPTTYELINSGNLAEIFQLSGYSARPVVDTIEPQNVRDIMVCNSICRPGPAKYTQVYADRMHGKEEVIYKHPSLEPILKDTYGIMLYQESIMRVSQVVAGFTGQQADILRKATSKKKGFEKIKDMFITGAKTNGYDDDFIAELWTDILEFAGYAFNAAHSCAYARVAVKMAYLKAHYPIEFYAAALTRRIGNDDKFNELVREMLKSGIKILAPRLGISETNEFAIDDELGAVRFPYRAVKNVGKTSVYLTKISVIKNIDECTFDDLALFKKTGKRALESLAFVGAFDDLFGDRNEACEAVPYLSRGLIPVKQMALFEERPKYTKADFFSFERRLTGLYLTGNPLEGLMPDQVPFSNDKYYKIMDGHMSLFVGIIKSVRTHRDKKGNLMAFVKIEDRDYDEMSITVFADLYEVCADKLKEGMVVKILGKINVRYGKTKEEELRLKKYGRVSLLATKII